MRTAAITFFLSMILLAACTGDSKDSPEGLWIYTHSSAALNEKTPQAPAFLWLAGDGNYTASINDFEHGRWTAKGKTLTLTDQLQQSRSFEFMKHTRDLVLMMPTGANISFEKRSLETEQAQWNPFSVDNNRWRVRATGKENDQQLTARLKNHCAYWEAWFAWAHATKLKSIDVRSTPTPIKIYGNGFQVKAAEDLPESWKKLFYDESDCRRANEILNDVVRRNTISWPPTDNRFRMFLSAFQQLEEHLGEHLDTVVR